MKPDTFDFHTHRMDTVPGKGIVCLPQSIVLRPEAWTPQDGGHYAAGIHPWWTAAEDFDLEAHLDGLRRLLQIPEVVQLGECGIDALRGASPKIQEEVLRRQIALSEELQKPVTLHCVRAFDRLLALKKQLRPTQRWTIHGFRGKPALAQQLLDAGFDLSFGPLRNEASFNLTPLERRHEESDAE